MDSAPALAPPGLAYEFGAFEVVVPARELKRDGKPVHIQPKAFDVLVYLLVARDRVVSKDELLEKLWPGEVVAETSLTFAVKAIRRALDDDGTSQKVLKTFHGRGYRFVASLRERSRDAGSLPASGPAARARSSLRDRIMLQPATTRFVGREDECVLLDSELAVVRQGQARTVFVLGDPGVGKTRLVAEFADVAEAAGAQVLVGRCDQGTPPSFWPWVQVVRSFLERNGRLLTRRMAGPGAFEIARLLPAILGDDETCPVTAPADAEYARIRLFDSLVEFLCEASRHKPVVIVIDDLHWADASSLLLLQHLVRAASGSSLLILATYRQAEMTSGGALADLLGWLHRTKRSTRIRLRGLADDDVAALVHQLSGRELSGDALAALGKATDGNPFFVEEFCRDLVDRADTDAQPTQDVPMRVPDEVRHVILHRVDRLGPAVREVLGAAAVLGREFRYDDLLAATGDANRRVREAVAAAEASGLVHADPQAPGTFAFAHALVGEVLLDSLGTIERAHLHRAAGLAIEARPDGDPLWRASELARHFGAAAAIGETRKAFACAREAGRLLLERFAFEDASVHFDNALRFARAGVCDDGDLFEMLLAQARASFHGGAEKRARDLIFEAVTIARRLDSTEMLARAAIRTSTLFPVTPSERVMLLEEALAALRAQDEPDRRLLSRVLAALASGLYASVDEVRRREALVNEALTIARSLGEPKTLLHVIRASHVALWRPGHLRQRLALAREHVDVAENSGDLVEMAAARSWYVPALVESGRIAESDRQVELLDREAADTRMMVYSANALSFRAMRALTRGAFDDVEFFARRSYELLRRYDETTASMTLWSQIYYLRREQGRLEEIEPGIRLFASQVPQISWDWLHLHLLCEDGRFEESRGMLDRMVSDDFRQGLPPDAHIVWLAALLGLVETAARLGHRVAAERLLPRLESCRDQWIVVGLGGVCLGSVSYARGLALGAVGRTDEAVDSLEQAEREHQEAGVDLPLLRTRAELALLLSSRRDRPSRRRGAGILATLRSECDARGLVQLRRVIDAAGS